MVHGLISILKSFLHSYDSNGIMEKNLKYGPHFSKYLDPKFYRLKVKQANLKKRYGVFCNLFYLFFKRIFSFVFFIFSLSSSFYFLQKIFPEGVSTIPFYLFIYSRHCYYNKLGALFLRGLNVFEPCLCALTSGVQWILFLTLYATSSLSILSSNHIHFFFPASMFLPHYFSYTIRLCIFYLPFLVHFYSDTSLLLLSLLLLLLQATTTTGEVFFLISILSIFFVHLLLCVPFLCSLRLAIHLSNITFILPSLLHSQFYVSSCCN